MPASNESSESRYERVLFDLEPDACGFASTERLWGVVKKGYRYELANIPFYVSGVACGDLVQARPDDARREFVFESVLERSGSSTVWASPTPDQTTSVATRLLDLGCYYEQLAPGSHLALDVLGGVNYRSVLEVFASMEPPVEFKEAYISPKHRADTQTPVAPKNGPRSGRGCVRPATPGTVSSPSTQPGACSASEPH